MKLSLKIITLINAILIHLINLNVVEAQNFNLLIGDEGNDAARGAVEAVDDGYIIIGTSTSNVPLIQSVSKGSTDIWVVKLSKIGEIIWNRFIGGNNVDVATSIIQTNDDNYLILGYSFSDNSGDFEHNNGGNADVWIIKIDQLGNIIWDTTISSEKHLTTNTIYSSKSGSFTFSGTVSEGTTDGTSSPDRSWLVELNGYGEVLWDSLFRAAEFDYQFSFYQTTDGNYISSGTKTDGYLNSYNYVVELDKDKKLIQEFVFGNGRESLSFSKPLTDGGLLMLSGSYSSSLDSLSYFISNENYLFSKINSKGKITQHQFIGGSSKDSPRFFDIVDDGYLLTGLSFSSNSGDINSINNGSADTWVVKLDTALNIVWERLIGGSDFDDLSKITATSDGGCIVTGFTKSSNSGDILTENQGESDAWIIKMDANGNFDTRVSTIEIPPKPLYQIFPNPFVDALQIDLQLPQSTNLNVSVYNANGQLVKVLADGIIGVGKQQFSWKNLSELKLLPSGNYWCNFTFIDHKLSNFSVPLQKH